METNINYIGILRGYGLEEGEAEEYEKKCLALCFLIKNIHNTKIDHERSLKLVKELILNEMDGWHFLQTPRGRFLCFSNMYGTREEYCEGTRLIYIKTAAELETKEAIKIRINHVLKQC